MLMNALLIQAKLPRKRRSIPRPVGMCARLTAIPPMTNPRVAHLERVRNLTRTRASANVGSARTVRDPRWLLMDHAQCVDLLEAGQALLVVERQAEVQAAAQAPTAAVPAQMVVALEGVVLTLEAVKAPDKVQVKMVPVRRGMAEPRRVWPQRLWIH